MFENWQKLVSTRKLFILFLRIIRLHEIKQNEKYPYCARAQSISQHVDAGQLNVPPQQ